jgi:biotin transport system substrate-specific component
VSATRTVPAVGSPGRSVVEQALLILYGAAAVALSARISVPLAPVPVTAQTLAVLLVGALLGPVRGTLSVLTYLLAGIAQLPVFAGGGGPLYLVGPTGGYLLGFLPAAYVTGTLVRRGRIALALLAGDTVIFAVGLAWLAAYVGGARALLAAGLLPFLPGEAVKVAVAGLICQARRG